MDWTGAGTPPGAGAWSVVGAGVGGASCVVWPVSVGVPIGGAAVLAGGAGG